MSEHEGTVGPVWSPDVDTDSDTNKYSARATPHLLTLKENWISRVQNVLSASHTLTLMSMNLCMGSYHCSSTTLASRPQHRNTQPRCGLPADNRFSSISTDRSEICLLWSSQGFFFLKNPKSSVQMIWFQTGSRDSSHTLLQCREWIHKTQQLYV